MRKTFPLNFDWKYSPEYTEQMLLPSFDDKAFETVDIPHSNLELPYNYFDEKSYQFVSCYRKSFTLDKKQASKRYILHFEGAAVYAEVYLNGEHLGGHKGAYTPFAFDVTDSIVTGNNLIAVMLDSTERADTPPFGNVVDYLVYGGIYREVWLEEVPQVYIKNVFVRTQDVLSSKPLINADVEFSETASGKITVELFDNDNLIFSKTDDFTARILKVKKRVGGVELWDTENPKLYTLKVSVNGEDAYTVRFGFRECKFKRDGFYLNGKKIKLRGLNRHQSYPYVGNAMPRSAQEADALLLKNTLGLNLVRTSHYPDSVHFLNKCDEIGLLVFTEMPSWQYIGEGEWRENAINSVREMVLRDRNHPCIILWGVRVNEGADCDELYEITNSVARTLDDTRQTGGVRNMPRTHLLEDVYTYNDFSHSGGKTALLPPTIVTGIRAPYLVTEHNGHMFPTKQFDREALRTEHAMRHTRVLNRAYGNKRISGAIGWCMADYNTHKDFGSGDRICYHGVTDMFRIPKGAASIYSSQQDNSPYMDIISSMDIGEHPGAQMGKVWIFTNCDYVKLYKNGVYTSTARPDYRSFPNLPHPPMLAADFIGDALKTVEGLEEPAASMLHDALVAAFSYGFAMPPVNFLKIGAAFVSGGMSFEQIYNIVTKYIANWGGSQITYTFEGYKNGECVKTITKTAATQTHLQITADSDTLCEGDTYDVVRIELTARDQNNNRIPFADDAVTVSVKGPARVIGPSRFPLVGGARAFWLRTTGGKGKVTVTVDSETYGKQKLELSAE